MPIYCKKNVSVSWSIKTLRIKILKYKDICLQTCKFLLRETIVKQFLSELDVFYKIMLQHALNIIPTKLMHQFVTAEIYQKRL